MSAREDNLQHYEAIADHFDTTYNRENSNQLYKIEQISKVMFGIFPSLGRYDIMELGGERASTPIISSKPMLIAISAIRCRTSRRG